MRRFGVIAIAFLLWNLAGLAAFVMQWTATPDDLGDPLTAEAFATMPGWAWAAYGVAVISGALAAIALLLRRKLALPLFVVSLIGVIAQFSWSIVGFDIVARKGAGALVFPAVIAGLALTAVIYTRTLTANRTLR